jgi:hypothetical protein
LAPSRACCRTIIPQGVTRDLRICIATQRTVNLVHEGTLR